MTRKEFQQLLQAGPVFLDGATGSNLRAAGMPAGVNTEAWVLEHPEVLAELQRAYAEAGSQIVCAPTFGANAVSLALYGLEESRARLEQLTQRAIDAIAPLDRDGFFTELAKDLLIRKN